MPSNDVRVDTTFIGYLLIGFVLLLLGVFGLQNGELFGDATLENYKNLPLDTNVLMQACGIIGLMLVLLTVFAYRTGKGPAAAMFAFFGITFIVLCYDNYDAMTLESIAGNSNWFLYLALAIVFFILTVYALAGKAPKFVAVLLLLMGFTLVFMTFASYNISIGPGNNEDLTNAFSIVYAIFSFLGFIVATYLGLAYANPKRIPVI